MLALEGVAIVASWYGAKPVTLPLGAEFHRRRLEIRSSQVSTIGARAARWDRQRRLEATRGLLGELPLGDVADDAIEEDAAVRGPRGVRAVAHPAQRTVRAQDPILGVFVLRGARGEPPE